MSNIHKEKKEIKVNIKETRELDEKFAQIFTKQLDLVKKREDYLNSLREQKKREEVEGLTFKPEISKRAKHVKEFGYDFRVKKKKLRKIWKKKRRVSLKKEESTMTTKPYVSEKSKKIIKKKQKNNTYISPIKGWDKRFERFKELHSEPVVDKSKFHPILSEKTEEITRNRNGVVFDRLFEESVTFRKNLKEKVKRIEPKFKPTLSHGSTFMVKERKETVFDDLFEKAKIKKEKLERRRNRKDVHSYSPQLNERSLKLATKKGKRKPLYVSPQKKLEEIEREIHMHKEEKKKVRKKKRRSTKKKKKNENIFDKLFENSKVINQKKSEMMKREKERKVRESMKECTFSPFRKKSYGEKGGDPFNDLYERSVQSKKRKMEKIKNHRKRKEEEEVKECTFSPNIKRAKQRSPTTESKKKEKVAENSKGYSKVFKNEEEREELDDEAEINLDDQGDIVLENEESEQVNEIDVNNAFEKWKENMNKN